MIYSALSAVSSPERTQLRQWWNEPIGKVPPVLALTGEATSEKVAILDDFVLATVTANRTAAPEARINWARLYADGSVASGGDEPLVSLERLLAATLPGSAAEPAPYRPVRILLVDDYDALVAGQASQALRLLQAMVGGDRLDRAGLRVVVGAVAAPVPGRAVPVPYLHPRDDLIQRVTAWATDPRDEPILVVRGRPGSGKTRLLTEAGRRLDRRDELRIAFQLLRDPVLPKPLGITELVAGFARAIVTEGVSFGDVRAQPFLLANVQVGSAATVIGIQVNQVTLPPSSATMSTLRAELEARTAGGRATMPLLLIIDGLNELEEAGGAAVDELRAFLGSTDELIRWNVKVLLSTHSTPDFPAAVIDLDDVGLDDVRSYTLARLRARGIPDAIATALATPSSNSAAACSSSPPATSTRPGMYRPTT